MSDTKSKLPDWMPKRGNGPVNIVTLLGAANKWDYTHKELLGETIIVNSVDATKHASKDAAIAQCIVNGESAVVLFASKVLATQLLSVQEHLPVTVKIAQKGKRYHFTA